MGVETRTGKKWNGIQIQICHLLALWLQGTHLFSFLSSYSVIYQCIHLFSYLSIYSVIYPGNMKNGEVLVLKRQCGGRDKNRWKMKWNSNPDWPLTSFVTSGNSFIQFWVLFPLPLEWPHVIYSCNYEYHINGYIIKYPILNEW